MIIKSKNYYKLHQLKKIIESILFCLIVVSSNDVFSQVIQRPALIGDAHMALFVSDINKTRSFYGDFLGFQEPYCLKNSDSSLIMTFFKVNENQYIEISPNLKPGQDFLNHIAFETSNAEQMRLYLASKGFQVPEKANKVRIGNTSFNIKDPDGHTVEFTQ